MVTLDLLDFALHGRLGPFHRQMSRADIESILGPSDDCYPALVAFGHVSFDLGDGIGPPCAPQIQFLLGTARTAYPNGLILGSIGALVRLRKMQHWIQY